MFRWETNEEKRKSLHFTYPPSWIHWADHHHLWCGGHTSEQNHLCQVGWLGWRVSDLRRVDFNSVNLHLHLSPNYIRNSCSPAICTPACYVIMFNWKYNFVYKITVKDTDQFATIQFRLTPSALNQNFRWISIMYGIDHAYPHEKYSYEDSYLLK